MTEPINRVKYLAQKPATIAVLLAFIPFVYLALFGRFGWSQGDDGFILAHSWRILNGELPYRDFIYVRPPLSPYLHSLYLYIAPDNYAYLFSRFFVVTQIYSYSLLSAYLLLDLFKENQNPFNSKSMVFTWGLVGFVISVTALTPIPWHTVDGVFFAVIAFYLLTKKSTFHTILSAFFFIFSLLTKQSFYPLAILFPLLLVFEKRYFHALIYCLFYLVGVICLFSTPLLREFVTAFVDITKNTSTIRDAIQAGVITYFKSPARLLAVFTLAIAFSYVISKWRRFILQPLHYFLLLLVISVAFCIWLQLHYSEWINHKKLGLLHILLLSNGLLIIGLYAKKQLKIANTLCALTAIAWCSSVSWGYQTPVLFASPLVIGSFELFRRFSSLTVTEIVFLRRGTMLCYIAIAFIVAWQPYHDAPRSSLQCNLGSATRKLHGIISTDVVCEKVKTAQNLASRYQQNSIFLPDFDLAYFLFDLKNPLPIDWPMNAESGNARDWIESASAFKVRYAIIDIASARANATLETSDRFYVPLVQPIMSQWRKIESNEYYEVYLNPQFVSQ